MSKEAMKLALEALQTAHLVVEDDMLADEIQQAITAIREALAEQPAQQEEPPDVYVVVARAVLKKLGIDDDVIDTIAGRSTQQPAQQQEPVKACATGQCPCKSECDSAQCCLYTSPPASKPLAFPQEAAAFKAWFDAWYVGDGEQGETIPGQSDPHFLTYLDQYTLGFGAWMAAKHAARAGT